MPPLFVLVFLLCSTRIFGENNVTARHEKRVMSASSFLSEDDLASRIVGGHKVSIVEYPYTANYGMICGAAVLNEYWLITAGHCGLYDVVYTGSTFISRTKKTKVIQHVVHPNYKNADNKYQFDYDFQLLKVETPLKLNKLTSPIQLGSENEVIVGTYATVTGWGSTYEEGPTSNHLLAVEVPVISSTECKKKGQGEYANYVSERMFCAGYKKGGKDTCQGDSGGPLTFNKKLIGIVSFGVGCAEADMPGVYAKVASVRDWIADVTGIKL